MIVCFVLYFCLCVDYWYLVCLLVSYFIVVRFWDNFRFGVGEKGIFILYEVVDYYVSYELDKLGLLKVVFLILNYMIRLVCGKEVFLFDVLGDVIDLENVDDVERVLVLVFIMFCNCGRGILIFLDKVLLENIVKVKLSFCLFNYVIIVLEEI